MYKPIRVTPRDLFNDAKLLKCLGRFIYELKFNSYWYKYFDDYIEDFDGNSFEIIYTEEGYVYCSNLKIELSTNGKFESIFLYTFYNSKANYPLYGEFERKNYQVLDEEGNIIMKEE